MGLGWVEAGLILAFRNHRAKVDILDNAVMADNFHLADDRNCWVELVHHVQVGVQMEVH